MYKSWENFILMYEIFEHEILESIAVNILLQVVSIVGIEVQQ